MSYVLGIDIGTSFTAAAITRLGNDDSPVPQTLNLGLHTSAVPSVIFMADDGKVVVGEAAERRGFNSPDRVVREFKRRIGDTVPIVAGDLCVNAEDIFAVMARWVADRAEEREGEPPEAVTISHPAGWGEYKTGLIRHALAGVGLAAVTLLSEPEAAALHYGSQERVDPGSTIAVYDLGGGTFDAALLRKTSEETFEPLGRPAGIERLGGADFDEAVFRHVAASMGDTFGRLDVGDPAVLLALSRVRRECREAKEALSSDSEATIPVLLPETHSQVRLVRSEFEAMIDAPVRQTVETLAGALEAARLDADDLSVILLIGGSSRIPLVAQLLSDQLDRPIAVDADPKSSICLGAAYAAAAQIKAAAAETGGEAGVGIAGAGAGTVGAGDDGEATVGGEDDTAATGHHESDAHAAPVLATAVGRHENKQSHYGARIAAIAAGALILTGLTAAAAQGPSGLFGPLTSLSAQQPDSGDAQGSHQKGKQEHDGGSAAAGNGDATAYEDAEAVSGANSRADAAATAEAEEAAADGGGGGDGDGGDGASDSPAGNVSGTTTADATGDSSPKNSTSTKDRNNTGTTASPSNTGSPSPGKGGSGPTPGTTAPAPPGTQNPAPGSGDPAPTPGTPGTAAPDPGPGTGTPPPDPGTAPGTPVPEPSTGAGPVDPAPGTSAPPSPPPPAPTETVVPGPASSTQPVAPASGAPSSSTAPTP